MRVAGSMGRTSAALMRLFLAAWEGRFAQMEMHGKSPVLPPRPRPQSPDVATHFSIGNGPPTFPALQPSEGRMRTEFDRAYVEAHGTVAVLKLNHPDVLNAASPKLIIGTARALDFIAKPDSGFRCVVLTGEGRGF